MGFRRLVRRLHPSALKCSGRQSRPCAILCFAPNLRRKSGAAQKGCFVICLINTVSRLCPQDNKPLKSYDFSGLLFSAHVFISAVSSASSSPAVANVPSVCFPRFFYFQVRAAIQHCLLWQHAASSYHARFRIFRLCPAAPAVLASPVPTSPFQPQKSVAGEADFPAVRLLAADQIGEPRHWALDSLSIL